MNTILRDPELEVNRISEGTGDAVLPEEVSEVDRAVGNYINSIGKTFSLQYHKHNFNFVIYEWKNERYVCSFLSGPGPSALIKLG